MNTLTSLALSLLLAGSAAATAGQKPNIVFLIADDCTFRDIGCYGGQAHTPNIDQLASEGMRFTRCFQAAPMCSPTRHNIYTGLYPVKSGAYPNHTRLDPGVKTVVQHLTPLGYRVAHSGKKHVGPRSSFGWELLKRPEFKSQQNPDFVAVDQFLGDCQAKDTPFCLFLCSNEPHTPWNKGDASRYPPEKLKLPSYYVDTPETREGFSRYLAEITYYDSQVGQALDLLKKHKLQENTVVIVVSEQGNSLPFAKWTCYDHGLQSICVVRWPGNVAAGTINPAMFEYVDFLPTFVELAGGTPPDELDGKSIVSALRGKETHKDHVFGIMTTRGIHKGADHFGIRSVRGERFKLIWNFTPEVTFENACTASSEFKSWRAKAAGGDERAAELVRRYEHRPEFELFDLKNDPLEQTNLAKDPKHAEELGRLRKVLEGWMKDCGDLGQPTEMKALEHMPGRAVGPSGKVVRKKKKEAD